MLTIRTATIAATAAIAFAIGHLGAQTRSADKTLRELAQARVVPAAEVVKELDNRAAQGEQITPSFLYLQSNCHRLFEAQLAAARNQDERVAAAQQYVDRTRKSLGFSMSTKGRLAECTAQYDVADAEYRLAELKSQ